MSDNSHSLPNLLLNNLNTTAETFRFEKESIDKPVYNLQLNLTDDDLKKSLQKWNKDQSKRRQEERTKERLRLRKLHVEIDKAKEDRIRKEHLQIEQRAKEREPKKKKIVKRKNSKRGRYERRKN